MHLEHLKAGLGEYACHWITELDLQPYIYHPAHISVKYFCFMKSWIQNFPAGTYLFKVNTENTRTSIYIVNFEQVNAGWVDAKNATKASSDLHIFEVLQSLLENSLNLKHSFVSGLRTN